MVVGVRGTSINVTKPLIDIIDSQSNENWWSKVGEENKDQKIGKGTRIMKNGQIQKVPVAKLLEEKGYDENTKQDIAYMNDLVAKKE